MPLTVHQIPVLHLRHVKALHLSALTVHQINTCTPLASPRLFVCVVQKLTCVVEQLHSLRDSLAASRSMHNTFNDMPKYALWRRREERGSSVSQAERASVSERARARERERQQRLEPEPQIDGRCVDTRNVVVTRVTENVSKELKEPILICNGQK